MRNDADAEAAQSRPNGLTRYIRRDGPAGEESQYDSTWPSASMARSMR